MNRLPQNPKDILGLQKPPLRLVPAALSIWVAKAMEHGGRKYGPYNWRGNAVKHTVYLEAAMRHILCAMDGETVDSESGIPHEAHAAACMGIILDAMATGNLINDLPPAGAAAKLIKELTTPNGMESNPAGNRSGTAIPNGRTPGHLNGWSAGAHKTRNSHGANGSEIRSGGTQPGAGCAPGRHRHRPLWWDAVVGACQWAAAVLCVAIAIIPVIVGMVVLWILSVLPEKKD